MFWPSSKGKRSSSSRVTRLPVYKLLNTCHVWEKSKLVPTRLFCWKKKKKNVRFFYSCKDENRIAVTRQKCTGSGIHLGLHTVVEPLWWGQYFPGGRTELKRFPSLVQPSSRSLTVKTEALRPDQKMKLCLPWVCLPDSVQWTRICVLGRTDG